MTRNWAQKEEMRKSRPFLRRKLKHGGNKPGRKKKTRTLKQPFVKRILGMGAGEDWTRKH